MDNDIFVDGVITLISSFMSSFVADTDSDDDEKSEKIPKINNTMMAPMMSMMMPFPPNMMPPLPGMGMPPNFPPGIYIKIFLLSKDSSATLYMSFLSIKVVSSVRSGRSNMLNI